MAKNLIQHKRIKHNDVRHYILRDNMEKGNICMQVRENEDQVAHIFTKALNKDQVEKFRLKLGLIKLN